jgi:chemotaxis protein methyltransferase CheR
MEITTISDEEFKHFRELIYQLAGIALSPEKRQVVQSRLQRRLRHYEFKSFSDYYALVTGKFCPTNELEALVNCVTTNTTSFFREPHHFEFVKEHAVPALLSGVRFGDGAPTIRVWHAGCSTGEEPYSLAITFAQCRMTNRIPFTVRQLASDIDSDVLATAKAGVYDEEKLAAVPESVRRAAFLRGRGDNSSRYKVKPELQSQITFRQINLLDESWPLRPETKFDMIWCRNVVIYFDKPTQRRLFARFSERLAPGGYLFIGHSESLLGVSTAFDSIGQTIYRLSPITMEKAA